MADNTAAKCPKKNSGIFPKLRVGHFTPEVFPLEESQSNSAECWFPSQVKKVDEHTPPQVNCIHISNSCDFDIYCREPWPPYLMCWLTQDLPAGTVQMVIQGTVLRTSNIRYTLQPEVIKRRSMVLHAVASLVPWRKIAATAVICATEVQGLVNVSAICMLNKTTRQRTFSASRMIIADIDELLRAE
ncbi:hypothetical protein MRX96_033164 [Rhipicephalus microplus]